jgi:hypothetical protein
MLLVLTSCTPGSAPSAVETQATHAVATPTPDQAAVCAGLEERIKLDPTLPTVLPGLLTASGEIDLFRLDLARIRAHHCTPDPAFVTKYSESLAQRWLSTVSGMTPVIQAVLLPSTAAWIISTDPKAQEDAVTRMAQTALLYRAANQTTYASPPVAPFALDDLQREIRQLKLRLQEHGIPAY